MPISFQLNGKQQTLDVVPDMPLLWAIRDIVGLTGTKFGCGMALCGACTVYVDGESVRACTMPVGIIAGKKVTTIEAVVETKIGKVVRESWIAGQVPQCGYCQSGQIMSATALLAKNKTPTDADIDSAMAGNICRCGTYNMIRGAIKDAAQKLA